MPRQRIDSFWVDWIRRKAINEPQLTLNKLAKLAREEGEKLGRDDYPSERTIRRYREEIQNAPEEQQQKYRNVYWPETFLSGAIPWEAAPVVLELIQSWRDWRGDGRPTIRCALWFWRITLAAPGVDVLIRRKIAIDLWIRELFPEDDPVIKDDPFTKKNVMTYRSIEEFLMNPEETHLVPGFSHKTDKEGK